MRLRLRDSRNQGNPKKLIVAFDVSRVISRAFEGSERWREVKGGGGNAITKHSPRRVIGS